MANYDAATKDGKCVFCEIANGNTSTPGIFWENGNFMAFLSPWPNTEGFTVVIPKRHYGSDVLLLPDAVLKSFILVAKEVAKILTKHFEDVGRVGLIMEGTGVNHAHIKLFPMHGTAHLKQGIWKQYLNNQINYFERYEGYITSTDGPKADPDRLDELAKKLRVTPQVPVRLTRDK